MGWEWWKHGCMVPGAGGWRDCWDARPPQQIILSPFETSISLKCRGREWPTHRSWWVLEVAQSDIYCTKWVNPWGNLSFRIQWLLILLSCLVGNHLSNLCRLLLGALLYVCGSKDLVKGVPVRSTICLLVLPRVSHSKSHGGQSKSDIWGSPSGRTKSLLI